MGVGPRLTSFHLHVLFFILHLIELDLDRAIVLMKCCNHEVIVNVLGVFTEGWYGALELESGRSLQ